MTAAARPSDPPPGDAAAVPAAFSLPAAFPFPAVVGYDDAKLALLLCAVDPRLGGVLLRGDKGTAKSTLARGLAALLPHAPFVELPLGATEDRVVGSVDVAAALDGGGWQVRPGLLGEADGGVLYVDEVNLLAGHLVDVLLDAAASGVGRVERDGLSHVYPARFVLVGSMNPEEGELRPQLLDRFGLVVDLGGHGDPGNRSVAVRRRLAFDRDPVAFTADWAEEERALHDALDRAAATDSLLPDGLVDRAAALCTELGIETLRADLTVCRAATALARLEGAPEATVEHLARVAPLALAHRRRRGPFDDGRLHPDEVHDALARTQPEPDAPPGDPAGACADATAAHAGGAHAGSGGAGGDASMAGGAAPTDGAPGDEGLGGPGDGDARAVEETTSGDDADGGASEHGGDVGAGGSPPVPDAPSRDRGEPAPTGPQTPRPAPGGPPTASQSARPVPPPDVPLHLAASPPRGSSPADRTPPSAGSPASSGAPRSRPGRGDTAAPTGRVVGHRPVSERAAATGLAPGATLLAAARRQVVEGDATPLAPADLRIAVRQAPTTRTLVVGLDTSASMGAQARIDAARDAVLRVLLDAYQRRERVALVAIGGDAAHVVMQPTGSVEVARARLAGLAPGGPTPLADGLATVAALALQARQDGSEPLVVLVTDGRATAGPPGAAPFDAALDEADRVAAAGLACVVVDAEEAPGAAGALGLARELAVRLGARHLRLDRLDADHVERALRGGPGD